MNKLLLLSTVLFFSISCSACTEKTEVNTPNISDKEKVVAVLKSIETGEAEPISYINANKYIQHN